MFLMVRRNEFCVIHRNGVEISKDVDSQRVRILATRSILLTTAKCFDNHFRVALIDFKLGDS